MAALDHLPTGIIAQIVEEQLKPRLYIDFVCYLPPEICLKIFGHLDALSLLHVALACRAWYSLAIDRTLWERLYHLEGWKVIQSEIRLWEEEVNRAVAPTFARQTPRAQSPERSHAHKKRAISMFSRSAEPSTTMEDTHMPDADSVTSPGHDVDPQVASTRKGKGVAPQVTIATPSVFRADTIPGPSIPSAALGGICPSSSLRMYDSGGRKYKINWKHLYTMRCRLESNWDMARFTNFQMPHPDYPDEGHCECVYTLQHDARYLVSGSRDKSLRIWDLNTCRLVCPPLVAHTGSVLCLQFDADPAEDLIVSGSSDSNVVLWRFSTGDVIQTLRNAHHESVLNIKFDKRILVTCSKDKTVKIFNRKPLRYSDMGYPGGVVEPVPVPLQPYNTGLSDPLDERPLIQPYTLIACLRGHSAAVNAVQIMDNEVVSASGDRLIKVWDWPTQTCVLTALGHGKGIACVQYDGRRIVSGSSDSEVKIFDRQTGLEVASLRSHSGLVRTVQAGFADLPGSAEDDARAARDVDLRYLAALEAGLIDEGEPYDHARRRARRLRNPGSRRPEDITAFGASIPPGGGGGKYGRIVSGSYDTNIIIWRRDKDGIWRDQHRLRQDEAALAARRATRRRNHSSTAINPPPTALPNAASAATPAPPTQNLGTAHATMTSMAANMAAYRQTIDVAVANGQAALDQAFRLNPALATMRSYLDVTINRLVDPALRQQLRHVVNLAIFRYGGGSVDPDATTHTAAIASPPLPPPATTTPPLGLPDAVTAVTGANAAHPHLGNDHHAGGGELASVARVFKLQFDARRIVCCNQSSVILGWDFCNGDPELEETSRFFHVID